MTEYIVQVSGMDTLRLMSWLADGSGAFTVGRVTFESVEDGGLLVRIRPYEALAQDYSVAAQQHNYNVANRQPGGI